MASLETIKALALSGKKITAIKKMKDSYRQMGLREAKDFVEALQDGSLSILEAEEQLKSYGKLTAAVHNERDTARSNTTPNSLMTKNKADYTKTVLIGIILLLLLYVVYLKW